MACASRQSPPCASRSQVAERGGAGEDGEDPVEHRRLPLPERPGGQLPAGYGGILLLRHGGGDAYQELVARLELQMRSETVMRLTQSVAWRWTCSPLMRK